MDRNDSRATPDTRARNRMASGDEVNANAPRTDNVGGARSDNPADAWTGQYPPKAEADKQNEQDPQPGLRHQEHEFKKGDSGGVCRDI